MEIVTCCACNTILRPDTGHMIRHGLIASFACQTNACSAEAVRQMECGRQCLIRIRAYLFDNEDSNDGKN